MPPTTSSRHDAGQPRLIDRGAETAKPIGGFRVNRRERVGNTIVRPWPG